MTAEVKESKVGGKRKAVAAALKKAKKDELLDSATAGIDNMNEHNDDHIIRIIITWGCRITSSKITIYHMNHHIF